MKKTMDSTILKKMENYIASKTYRNIKKGTKNIF